MIWVRLGQRFGFIEWTTKQALISELLFCCFCNEPMAMAFFSHQHHTSGFETKQNQSFQSQLSLWNPFHTIYNLEHLTWAHKQRDFGYAVQITNIYTIS